MTERNSWDSYSDPSVVRVSSFGQRTLKLCNRADTLYSDQFFWASRVQKLGVSFLSFPLWATLSGPGSDCKSLAPQAGLRVNSLHSSEVASALKKATTNR
jgi:hypothetical protein